MKNTAPSSANQLIHESSPYLLQHAYNPVNWHPWGEQALEKARQEKKLLLISIGYSACHWCHVMEHESFENKAIAAFMNDHYIAIKVDREERPDVDQVYMQAVQLLTGRGGWPLNCIALPDGRPIYAGTYFPPAEWLEMLKQVLEFTKTRPEETEEQARNLTHGIRSQESIYNAEAREAYAMRDLDEIFEKWVRQLDTENGGTKGAPKFPLPSGHRFLLFYQLLSGNKEALEAVRLTLHKMAAGGIYDQVGGGFARYSVDAEWKVPHFEKMLYDNAQLVTLYAEAFRVTRDHEYKRISQETLAFIKQEMTSPERGFYSALDADSEGVEGKYYTWSHDAFIQALVNPQIAGEKNEHNKHTIREDSAAIIAEYYSVLPGGNWEDGTNILHTGKNRKAFAAKHGITEQELDALLRQANQHLLASLETRVRPGLDDKILTSWNALMAKGFIEAYLAYSQQDYLDAALANLTFIRTHMIREDHRVLRNYKDGKATINGFLDDYAFTIAAMIAAYQATFDEEWLMLARQLTEYVLAHFHDPASGMLFYTSDLDPELVARKMEVPDNVIPSASSEMAKNLFLLGAYFDNNDYTMRARQMLDNVKEHALQGGAYYSNWDILMAWFAKDLFEVVIIGRDAEKIRRELSMEYLPDVLLAGGENGSSLPVLQHKHVPGQTTIYVCVNKTCQQPTTEVSNALRQIRELRKHS
ncbi:MAG: thioredoxin domain-containing protein [Bacteroidales bacterium]|nr:thioredoxin domain-containing protein [Bacteroidales bacterium]MDT8429901.1 thioredoxin domain-containing protein [Bacteroidales bacterium]